MERPQLAATTALVTGAAKRLGRAIALSLADAGMNVVVHYRRSRSDAALLCRDIKKKGVEAWALPCDLSDPDECETLIDRAQTVCRRTLSTVVNNASVFPKDSIDDVSLERVIDNVRINAWAPFAITRAFAKKARAGCIVNILDARLRRYDRTHVAYSLSKQMLAALTAICAVEFAPSVRVNAVAPGLILPPAGKTRAYLDKLKASVPLRAHGTPQDIADAVLYLVKSPFVTGQVLYVDGGKHLV
jgi:pteridine reductase